MQWWMESVILVRSIIYLCHPGLGICICKFGSGGKRRAFSVLGPGIVMGEGGGRGREGETCAAFPSERTVERDSCGARGRTRWNRRSAASRSCVLHLRLSPPRGLTEVEGLDINFCTFWLETWKRFSKGWCFFLSLLQAGKGWAVNTK